MALEIECLLKLDDNFYQEEEPRVEKDFLHKYTMTRLESLKKSSHFGTVLKNRVINNDFYTIYRKRNFIKKVTNEKKLYISFVMKKKVGNAVKRNRIKRKLKGVVQKMLRSIGVFSTAVDDLKSPDPHARTPRSMRSVPR